MTMMEKMKRWDNAYRMADEMADPTSMPARARCNACARLQLRRWLQVWLLAKSHMLTRAEACSGRIQARIRTFWLSAPRKFEGSATAHLGSAAEARGERGDAGK